MLSLPDFEQKKLIITFPLAGQRISLKNENLIISEEDNVVLQISCHKIFSLWIIGNTTITSGLLEKSKKFAFSIFLHTYTFRVYGSWNSSVEGNFLLRHKQYRYQENDIAKHLVKNKILNQIFLLKNIRNKSDTLKIKLEKMNEYHSAIDTQSTVPEILGYEGIASRVYFGEIYKDYNWKRRSPRAKEDITNTLLDIGYTYLFNVIESMLNLYGFDIYQGVYHRLFYQRKSLVCDIIEPFRCIIDRKIKKSFGLQQIKEEDFDLIKGQYFLKITKNKYYSSWLIEAILEYKLEIFNYVQDYYRAFMRSKEISQYPVFLLEDKSC